MPVKFSDAHKEKMFELFRKSFAAKPLAVWLDELDPNEIPVAPVLDLSEVAKNPHVKERGLMREDGVAGVAFPVRWQDRDDTLDMPAPQLGEHNWEFYGQIGYSEEEIKNLELENVI